MNSCPACGSSENQVKNGKNPSGTQRYLCKKCRRVYTPEAKYHGYDARIRQQAIEMYVDGTNLRRIARFLRVNHQTVANWVNAYVARLPPAPVPAKPEVIELDELFTFVGAKKNMPTS